MFGKNGWEPPEEKFVCGSEGSLSDREMVSVRVELVSALTRYSPIHQYAKHAFVFCTIDKSPDSGHTILHIGIEGVFECRMRLVNKCTLEMGVEDISWDTPIAHVRKFVFSQKTRDSEVVAVLQFVDDTVMAIIKGIEERHAAGDKMRVAAKVLGLGENNE